MSDIQLKVGRFYQDGKGNVLQVIDKHKHDYYGICYILSDQYYHYEDGRCCSFGLSGNYNLIRELLEWDWIIHDSDAQPVNDTTIVRVLFDDGKMKQREAQYFEWNASKTGHPIKAYIVVKEEEKPVEVKEEIKVGDYVQYQGQGRVFGPVKEIVQYARVVTDTEPFTIEANLLISDLVKVKTITKAEAEAKLGCKIVGE